MMLVHAMRHSLEIVYGQALEVCGDDDIARAYPAPRGITIPSQPRTEIRKDGRDLVGAFRALAPPSAPIRIQRWSLRRLGVTVGAILGGVIAISLLWGNLNAVGLR